MAKVEVKTDFQVDPLELLILTSPHAIELIARHYEKYKDAERLKKLTDIMEHPEATLLLTGLDKFDFSNMSIAQMTNQTFMNLKPGDIITLDVARKRISQKNHKK